MKIVSEKFEKFSFSFEKNNQKNTLKFRRNNYRGKFSLKNEF